MFSRETRLYLQYWPAMDAAGWIDDFDTMQDIRDKYLSALKNKSVNIDWPDFQKQCAQLENHAKKEVVQTLASFLDYIPLFYYAKRRNSHINTKTSNKYSSWQAEQSITAKRQKRNRTVLSYGLHAAFNNKKHPLILVSWLWIDSADKREEGYQLLRKKAKHLFTRHSALIMGEIPIDVEKMNIDKPQLANEIASQYSCIHGKTWNKLIDIALS